MNTLKTITESINRRLPDTWEIDDEAKMIVRKHLEWRETLYVPALDGILPVRREQLTGKRVTLWKDQQGYKGSFIDDFLKSRDPERHFGEPWKGETKLEFTPAKESVKRKEAEEPPEQVVKKEKKKRETSQGPKAKREQTAQAAPSPEPAHEPSAPSTAPPVKPPSDTQMSVTEHFNMAAADTDEEEEVSKQPQMTEEVYLAVKAKIEELENKKQAKEEIEKLKRAIDREAKEEKKLVEKVIQACEDGEEAMVVSFEVDNLEAFISQGPMYTKAQQGDKLQEAEQGRPQAGRGSHGQEVSEVTRSQALRACREVLDEQTLKERVIPMRWLLTWKPVNEDPPDPSVKHEVLRPDGKSKAKARIILIGYKHPDLVRAEGAEHLLTDYEPPRAQHVAPVSSSGWPHHRVWRCQECLPTG